MWDRRLGAETRSLSMPLRQAWLQCVPARKSLSYSRFCQRVGLRHIKIGNQKQRRREDRGMPKEPELGAVREPCASRARAVRECAGRA